MPTTDPVVRGDVAGVPSFAAEAPGPSWAALVFRVGHSDETAAAAGITHLVEHLLMPANTYPAVDCNGTVDPLFSMLWASGEPHEVRRFLEDVVRRIHTLPVERLDLERRILDAEQAAAGWNTVRQAIALRLGPIGAGLAGWGNLGLPRVTADEAAGWARERFTSGNAALVTTDASFEIELDLPPGEARIAPELRPIPYVEYPSVYREAGPGAMLLSMLAERSHAFMTGFRILERRIRNRLRFELGIAYDIEADYQPLTAREAHAWVGADSGLVEVEQWFKEALAIFDALADDGPSEEELDVERSRRRREERDPTNWASWLSWIATEHLLGEPYVTHADVLRDLGELTPSAVANAIRRARATLLVVGSYELPDTPAFTEYPLSSPVVLDGRLHRPSGLRERIRRRGRSELTASPEGISIVYPGVGSLTARCDSTVVCMRRGETRTLLTDDGFHVVVDPKEWERGAQVVKEIDAAIPAELVVPQDAALDARIDDVDTLARATFKRKWLISDELEALPLLLEDGETLLALASASRGWRLGLVAVSDRRLRFLYGDGSRHSFVVERGSSAEARANGTELQLEVDGEPIELTDVQPKNKAAELAGIVQSWRDNGAASVS